jgi:RES domain-containing protein
MASPRELITAWRIVKKRYAAAAFDGEGARQYGGRWNSPGTAVVYLSESRALALLEVLVRLGSRGPLPAYVLVPVSFEAQLVEILAPSSFPENWQHSPPNAATQSIGDIWVSEQRSVVLRVPSVIVPDEYNYLVDPSHPAIDQVNIGPVDELAMDPRLL